MTPGRPVWPSQVTMAHSLSAGISCQAPRESAYEKNAKIVARCEIFCNSKFSLEIF